MSSVQSTVRRTSQTPGPAKQLPRAAESIPNRPVAPNPSTACTTTMTTAVQSASHRPVLRTSAAPRPSPKVMSPPNPRSGRPASRGTVSAPPPPARVVSTPPRDNNSTDPVLYQKWFKTGAQTYAVQIGADRQGRRSMILTEGRRDVQTGQVEKIRFLVGPRDLVPFFRMLHETAVFLRQGTRAGSDAPSASRS